MFDVIGAIDACYAPNADDREWIDGILAAVEGLSEGRGAYAIEYGFSEPRGAFSILGQRGPLPDMAALSAPIQPLLSGPTYRALYDPHPTVELLSNRARRLPPETARVFGEVFRQVGAPEVLGVFGGELDLCGVLVAVVRSSPGDVPGPRTLHLLRRLSAHLTSARRLRAAAGHRAAPDDAATDAVLSASGRIAHATGAARAPASREALSAAAQRIEWARGRARRVDPEAAARAWRGLVSGAWTIIDHVERDGRRWLLARRNPPGAETWRGLTAAEVAVTGYAALGHSNKHIGYLLGIAPSTVAKRLFRAGAKLGAPSRRALMDIVGWGRAGASFSGASDRSP